MKYTQFQVDGKDVCSGLDPCTIPAGPHIIQAGYTYYEQTSGESTAGKVLRFLAFAATGAYIEPGPGARSHSVERSCWVSMEFVAQSRQEYRLGANGSDSPKPEFFLEDKATGQRLSNAFCK